MVTTKDIRTVSTVAGLARFSIPELRRLDKELEKLATQMMAYGVRSVKALEKKRTNIDAVRAIRAFEALEPNPAKVVRDVRASMGLTQVEFAALIGVAGNTVARWERAEARVKPAMLKLIRVLAAAGPTPDEGDSL